MRTPSMCRSAVMSAIRPTACRAASTVTTNRIGITACMPTPSGSGQAAAPLNAIVAAVSSHAVWRSSGNGIRIHVSSRSSASSTQMPMSMPIGNTSEKFPNPFCTASARTAAYEPAKPIPAMTTAPATTTPMSIRCVRVSCIAATRDPLPLSSYGRHSVRVTAQVTECQPPVKRPPRRPDPPAPTARREKPAAQAAATAAAAGWRRRPKPPSPSPRRSRSPAAWPDPERRHPRTPHRCNRA